MNYLKYIIIHALITFFLFSFSYCSSNNNKTEDIKILSSEVLTGCISGNCIDGYGKFIYTDGIEYFGYWKAGKRDGYGTLIITNTPTTFNYIKKINEKKPIHIIKTPNTLSKTTKDAKKEESINENTDTNAVEDIFILMGAFVKVAESMEYVNEQNKIQKVHVDYDRKNTSCDIKYEGFWRNNKRNGRGQLTNADCSSIKGIWQDDVIIKQ